MIKAGLYPRVSTQEQAKEGYSVGEQKERLKSYCAAMGWTVYNTYTDAGYSGGNMDRPGLQAMIKDVEDGKIDKVVVYKLDRLSRSQKDALHMIEDVFLPNNVDFVSITENFDTSTAFGKAAIGMTAVFAQLEKENIRQRMEMGREAKAKSGYYIRSKQLPLGYDYAEGKLIINEDADIVKMIYKMYLDGYTQREICAYYHDRGYIDTLSVRTIGYILRNSVYAGYVFYSGKTYDGIHEPIVTKEDFAAVQRRLAERQAMYKKMNLQTNGDTHTTLLGGMLYCKRCGARYGKSTSGPVNNRYGVYECYSRSKDNIKMVRNPNCKNKIWRVGDLDRIVLDALREIQIDPTTINRAEKKDKPSKSAIQRKIAQTSEKITRLLDLYADGKIPVEQLDDKIQQLTSQRDALQAQLSDDLTAITPETAKITVSNLGTVLNLGDRTEIRKIIETLISRIDLDGEDVYISWRF